MTDEQIAQCRDARDEFMRLSAQLEAERGYTPLLLADALFGALAEIGVAFAGREATANCLIEWAERLKNPQQREVSHVRH